MQFLAVAAMALGAVGVTDPPASPTAAQPPACEVTQAKHARYVRAVYREREEISRRARERMIRLKDCAKSVEAERDMVLLRRREARAREERKEAESTPFRFAMASRSERIEMMRYVKHPLPWCTWGPESGAGRAEWSIARYRQPNVSGGSGGGKFQILTSTWAAFGGFRYAAGPVIARPVLQERMARKIAKDGLHHWINC
jgi:hypothetical protein